MAPSLNELPVAFFFGGLFAFGGIFGGLGHGYRTIPVYRFLP
jgi:hypothetical protein